MSTVSTGSGEETFVVVSVQGGSLWAAISTVPGGRLDLLDSKKPIVFLKLGEGDHVAEVFYTGKMADGDAGKLCEKIGKVYAPKAAAAEPAKSGDVETQPSGGSPKGTDVVPRIDA